MSDPRHPSRRTGLFSGLAMAAIAVIVAACGSSSATPTPAPTTAPATSAPTAEVTPGDTTPMGGTITIRMANENPTWDPCVVQAATVPGTWGEMFAALYGSLVYTNTDGKVVPNMVESLTTKDALTWTFKLRAGVKFSDGTDLDATALKFNFDRDRAENSGCSAQKWMATWTSVDIVDATTLNVVLSTSDANFDQKIAENAAFIASPKTLQAAGEDKTKIEPIGAGPFTLQSRNPGVETVFVKNANYWDAPRPYIDKLVYPLIPQSNTGQAQIVTGQLDAMFGYAYQYGENATKPGVATQVVPINGYNIAYFINNGGTTGLFNDVDARMAVAYGVDRQKWVYALTQVADIKAPDSLYPPTSPYYDKSLVYPSYDPAMAQQLIDKVIAKGKKFEFTILVPNSSDTLRSAQYLQQAMSAYNNVTVNVNTVDGTVYNAECLAKHGDICIQPGASMWNGPEPNTWNLLSSKGSQPFAAYSSLEMDAALRVTLTAVSDADKVSAYKYVEQIFFRDLPFIQYGNQTRTMLIRDDVSGFVWAGQGQLQAQFLYRCAAKCH